MSDWKERAIRRRDERHTAAPEVKRPSGSKRNTKKWCRGVVGREHTPVATTYNELKRATHGTGWHVLICSTCKKELDNYWPSSWFLSDKPKPAWVP
jgi:hypothetical protein